MLLVQATLQRAEQHEAGAHGEAAQEAAASVRTGTVADSSSAGKRKSKGAAAARPAVQLEDDDPFGGAGPPSRRRRGDSARGGGGGSGGFVETERDRLIRTVRTPALRMSLPSTSVCFNGCLCIAEYDCHLAAATASQSLHCLG